MSIFCDFENFIYLNKINIANNKLKTTFLKIVYSHDIIYSTISTVEKNENVTSSRSDYFLLANIEYPQINEKLLLKIVLLFEADMERMQKNNSKIFISNCYIFMQCIIPLE